MQLGSPFLVFLLAKWSDYCQGLFEELAQRSPQELGALVLQAEVRPAHLSVAAEVLGGVAGTVAIDPLLRVLRHQSPMVREAAIFGLSRHGRDARVRAAIQRASMTDASPAVREASADALDEAGI